MNIETDFSITFDIEQMNKTQRVGLERMLLRPKMKEIYNVALEECKKCLKPQAGWDIFELDGIHHEQLHLKNGVELGGGPVVDVMGGATHLLLGICTIGNLFDEILTKIQKENMVKAVFLDSLGSWAVSQIRPQLIEKMKLQCCEEHPHASIALSPGESSWGMTDQAKIFSLLEPSKIGMSLTESMLMVPMKSLSFIMGLSDQNLGVETGSRCRYCVISTSCPNAFKD
jgi:hypothetical protein